MTSAFAITNTRAVLDDAILDNATIVVEDGIITSVSASRAQVPGALDGRGLLLLPGLVDVHSDGLEKEIAPRRTTTFETDFALQSFEARVRGAGVSTVFHGVGYQNRPRIGRSIERARSIFDTIAARRESASATVDHRVLYRFESRDSDTLDPLLADLERGGAAGAAAPLLSFEDHTPGQGQYRDPAQFAAALDPEQIPEGLTAAQHVADLMAEAEALLDVRRKNLARLEPLATEGTIRLLAHDPENPADVIAAHEAGATIAEFPVSIDAARAAAERDMWVVMGAPNALRGLSHSGNASARDLVAEGLCDVIASDYMPSAMLASVFTMAGAGLCSLPAAVALITAGPAGMAGLHDRGRLIAGRRADLVLVDDRGRWPEVIEMITAADLRLRPGRA